MAARDPELRRRIASAGGAATAGWPDAEARRADLAADRLEAHIRKVVDAAPPLTAAQRDRLAALFRPGADVVDGDQVSAAVAS